MLDATRSVAAGARVVRVADRRATRSLAALALLAPLVLHLGAHAQAVGFVAPGGSCTPAVQGCETDDECFDESGTETDTCDALDVDGRVIHVCRPALSLLCCSSAPTASVVCPDGLACADRVIGSLGICVPEDAEYCDRNTERIRRCHTSPAGVAPVAHEHGDCDGDLVPNGVERALGTDPCKQPPPRLGVWVADSEPWHCSPAGTCDELGAPCDIEGSEAARCVANDRTGDGAPICSAPPDLFCCGTLVGMECPEGECVIPDDVDDGAGFCTDSSLLCGRDEDALLACHTSPSGELATIEMGDCDGDGLANADERRVGRDPCVPEAAPDAGPMPHDGGAKPNDAGAKPNDAGATEQLDASQTAADPSFGGGGGCVCRASRGELGGAPIASVLVLLLTMAFRRRR